METGFIKMDEPRRAGHLARPRMKWFSRFSTCGLRAQIALVFGALVVALAVLLSLGFGELLKKSAQRDAGAALQRVSENASTLLANGLQRRSLGATVLANAETVWAKGLDSPEALQMLERTKSMEPFHAWIGVADTRGVVKNATGGMLTGQSVAQRPWFQKGLKGVHVGDVHPAKLLDSLLPPTAYGEPNRFVDFAAPIHIGNTVVGVVGIHGSWEWTRQVLESLTPPASTKTAIELFIFNREGQLILAPATRDKSIQNTSVQMPSGMGSDDNTGTAVVRWQDGNRYLTAVSPLQARNAASDLGWRIVARQPVELAFADAHHAVRMSLGIGLLAALLASLLAWLAARRLSMDLYALADAAAAVQADIPGACIPAANSNREVAQLSQALGRMTHRLLSAREAMEETVRQRTEQLQQANHALDRQASTDALTGLLNRRGFESKMAFALTLARRNTRPLSLITVDVDHFKRVNDTYGHEAGDNVLRCLSNTLQERLRSCDVIARVGGEEFFALLPDTDLEGAQTIAETLAGAMREHRDPVVGQVTISAGVATLCGSTCDTADLLRRADLALYEAKGQGRDRVCVAP